MKALRAQARLDRRQEFQRDAAGLLVECAAAPKEP